MRIRNLSFAAAAFAVVLPAQQATPLKLVPSEPLAEPRPPRAPTAPAPQEVRPAILNLKPSGDPLYLVDEPELDSEKDQWRTYRRPKVDPFSKDADGVAIQGYDVVSYRENRVEKGRAEFSAEHGGVTWRFATADHRAQFLQDPAAFLPEYGGFCAYSVGRGYPVTADPTAYAVEDRKLYVFFDKAVRTVWQQDQRRFVTAADRYWPQLHR